MADDQAEEAGAVVTAGRRREMILPRDTLVTVRSLRDEVTDGAAAIERLVAEIRARMGVPDG